MNYDPGDDDYFYIDTQNEPFAVDIYDSKDQKIFSNEYLTGYERRADGTAYGFGWLFIPEIGMQNFPVGLYKESITFKNFILHDLNAREEFYFFGLDGLNQNEEIDYIIMIGVDGVSKGSVSIVVDGITYNEPIVNGAAVFRSDIWPSDLEGKISITIYNGNSKSHTYYRTILEAATYWNYYQYQFIIIDKDFNGIEDQFEADKFPWSSFLPSIYSLILQGR